MDAVLSQFMAINSLRNSVIHNRSFVTIDGDRISSNHARRKPAHEERVSPELLNDLAADLNKISYHITSALINPGQPLRIRIAEAWGDSPLSDAWRYKPHANPLA